MTIEFDDCKSPVFHIHVLKNNTFIGIIRKGDKQHLFQPLLVTVKLDRDDIYEVYRKIIDLDCDTPM